MLNDRSSALALLQTRRSARPRDLAAPGPDAAELRQILTVATRTPDHGKLAPWRFVHVPGDKRGDFRALLEKAYREDNPAPGRLELEALDRFAHQAPTLIVALSRPRPGKIPAWEQELSCGAALMNLLLGAYALGYAAGWVTGWASYSRTVTQALGGREEDRIAGFVFIGTLAGPLEERPRPELDAIAFDWDPNGQIGA